jgi:hypothetical protein
MRRFNRSGAVFGDGFVFLALVGCGLVLANVAKATPVVSGAFEQLYNIGSNTLGFATGERLRMGAYVTSAAGSADLATIASLVSGSASTTNLLTGQTVNRGLSYTGSPSVGGLFTSVPPYNTGLSGSWSLSFSDGVGAPATVATPAIPQGVTQTPFTQSITLSGTGNSPTFSWAPPANTAVNGYRINIYDRAEVSSANPFGQILSRNFAPTTTSFTVSDASPGLQPGYNFNTSSRYSIEISLLQTRDGSNTNLGNPNVAALSRVYADFQIVNSGNIQVNLPTATVNGAYVFNLAVQPNVTYYVDPDVATGYRFAIGAGNPNFASVLLPSLQALPYHLSYLFGGTLFDVLVAGGVQYFFQAGGVNAFDVTGIDPGLGLDPSNPVAFITGLTFAGAGQFTGTQTPIVTMVAVPAPSSISLFAVGLLGLLMVCGRIGRAWG